jgi:signal transduction histidine kinase
MWPEVIELTILPVRAPVVGTLEKIVLFRLYCYGTVSGQATKPVELENGRLRVALESEKQRRIRAEQCLEEFTMYLSHDLREPLRTVGTYCELLARAGNKPDADTELLRHRIREAVRRIEALLSGMLEYSAAEPKNQYVATADLNQVLREAIAQAQPSLGTAEVTHDILPVVTADFDLLVNVMRHLLENGAKFRGVKDPRIHVSSVMGTGEQVIGVRDNGVGVPAAHRESIFQPFKRLHGRQYPGNGLGLAFCKKAIESHGGRIWVESEEEQGSTFFFTLPVGD